MKNKVKAALFTVVVLAGLSGLIWIMFTYPEVVGAVIVVVSAICLTLFIYSIALEDIFYHG